MATWTDVRRTARSLPQTSEERTHDHLSWVVGDKTFAWERPLRKSDLEALGAAAPKGPILAIRTADLEMKEALLLAKPALFFTTPHFDGYPAVLIRLPKITSKRLEEVLVEAWLARAPKRVAEAYLLNKSRDATRRKGAVRGRK